eukprot:TRINITY_DN27273_c0_g3_i1.p1 TRINITY_DN27273_c0_g3~~TRINITY_DN27273_c0_g3_i1.p1  ORF type:complete len:314 (-),score=85.41 TRINITY_DN27273_c0_g3_i1:244-1185(-)
MSGPPPPEATKQPDGSYMQWLEDGSTVRWTRRPDGTWRKPERVRAGFVGSLEQAKYVSPGVAAAEAAAAGRGARVGVPGMPPQTAAVAQQAGGLTKCAARNERRKEKRKEQAELNIEQERAAAERKEEQAACQSAPPRDVPVDRGNAAVVVDGASALPTSAAEDEKRRKAIEKKLRQVADLEARRDSGEQLNEDQQSKLDHKTDLVAQLAQLSISKESPKPRPSGGPTGLGEADAALPSAPASAAAETRSEKAASAAAISEGARSKKALEKKLRQVAEIEEKQARGEALNDDQLSKLSQKASLEAEYRAAAAA